MGERVRAKKPIGAVADVEVVVEEKTPQPKIPTVALVDAAYCMPVLIASLAARITYRAKVSHIPPAKEYRRYYAGSVQIAFVEVCADGLTLHIADHPDQCRKHEFKNERQLQAFLTEVLTEHPV